MADQLAHLKVNTETTPTAPESQAATQGNSKASKKDKKTEKKKGGMSTNALQKLVCGSNIVLFAR